MLYRIAADAVVLIHFGFIVFVVIGGLLLFKWRWLIWLHLPSVIWAALAVVRGWVCPLTPLENWLRYSAGAEFYSGSFIERYLIPVIYPSGLTRDVFTLLGVLLIIINVIIYILLTRLFSSHQPSP